MPLDDLPHDGEADAGAAGRPCSRRVDPVQALPDERELVRGNVRAGVGDLAAHGSPFRCQADRDLPAVGRVHDRVLNEVGDHLPDAVGIGQQPGQEAALVDAHADVARLQLRVRQGEGSTDHVVEPHLGNGLPACHRVVASKGIQALDETGQSLDLLVDRPQHVRRRLDDALGQRLGVAAQRRERRAQLVRDVLNKGAPKLLEAFQRRCHLVEGLRDGGQLRIGGDVDAGGKVPCRDPPGALGQPLEGPEDAANEPARRHTAERHRGDGGDGDDAADVLVDHGVRLLRRRDALHQQVRKALHAEPLHGDHDHRSHEQRGDDDGQDESGLQRPHGCATGSSRWTGRAKR